MTPTFRLACHDCGRFLGTVPFPVLCTGSVRWAPVVEDAEGLIYLRCQCRRVSRYEVVPNLTQGQLLQGAGALTSSDTQPTEKAA